MSPLSGIFTRLLGVICLGTCLAHGSVLQAPAVRAQTRPSSNQAAKGSPLISIERMGGYAGVYEKFSIYPDGRITNASGQTGHVPLQVLDSIRRRVEVLDVPKARDVRVSGMLCSDCFRYRIVFVGPAGILRTFSIEEPMAGFDNESRIGRDLRDLISGLKWK